MSASRAQPVTTPKIPLLVYFSGCPFLRLSISQVVHFSGLPDPRQSARIMFPLMFPLKEIVRLFV